MKKGFIQLLNRIEKYKCSTAFFCFLYANNKKTANLLYNIEKGE